MGSTLLFGLTTRRIDCKKKQIWDKNVKMHQVTVTTIKIPDQTSLLPTNKEILSALMHRTET